MGADIDSKTVDAMQMAYAATRCGMNSAHKQVGAPTQSSSPHWCQGHAWTG